MLVKCFFEANTKEHHFCGCPSPTTRYSVLEDLFCLKVKYAHLYFFEANTKEYYYYGGQSETARSSGLYWPISL
jgi:hypothetical protein